MNIKITCENGSRWYARNAETGEVITNVVAVDLLLNESGCKATLRLQGVQVEVQAEAEPPSPPLPVDEVEELPPAEEPKQADPEGEPPAPAEAPAEEKSARASWWNQP